MSALRFARRMALLLSLAVLASPLSAATYRVGTGKGCTHWNIQAAVDAAHAPDGDTILITDSLDYRQQSVIVRDKVRLTLEGGFATCQSTVPGSTRTHVDGAGGVASSVFVIEDASVTLRRLDVLGGDSRDHGGGLAIAGVASVGLENTRVGQNSALDGGGIAVLGANAILVLGTDSTVEVNRASRAGGGIFCRGAQVLLNGRRSRVVGNLAVDGAGIAAEGCRIHVATSSRYGDGGTIYTNSASGNGGGVHLVDSDLLMFGTDANLPVGFHYNSAAGFGGGLYLLDSSARIVDGIVDANHAGAGGGAVFMQARTRGASLALTRDVAGLPGAAACATPLACNRVTNNTARTAGGSNQHGAAVMLAADAADPPQPLSVQLANATLAGNAGHTLVRTQIANPSDVYLLITDTEVRHNTAGGNLVEIAAPTLPADPARVALALWRSTLAANTIGGVSALHSERNVSISHSIVWQPGRRVLTATGFVDAEPAAYSIVSDTVGLGAAPTNLVADPKFVDAANGNLRPSWASPAIDYAPASGWRARDGAARTIDLPSFWNRYGAQDAGAFEVVTDPGSFVCCAL